MTRDVHCGAARIETPNRTFLFVTVLALFHGSSLYTSGNQSHHPPEVRCMRRCVRAEGFFRCTRILQSAFPCDGASCDGVQGDRHGAADAAWEHGGFQELVSLLSPACVVFYYVV